MEGKHESAASETNASYTWPWLTGMVELAIAQFAMTLVAEIGGQAFNVIHAPWPDLLGVAAGAAVLSIARSLASAPLGDRGTNFLVRGSR